MVKTKILQTISISIFLLIALSFKVDAFGVSSPYWDENPLVLYPGDIKEFTMVLQNMVGNEDVTAEAKVNSGKEIMQITDQNTVYEIPFGSNNIPVNLKVTIPQGSKPGQEFQVGVSFKTVANNKGGVAIGSAIDKGFKVKVIEQPKPSTQATKVSKISIQPIFGVIIGIIVLLLLLLLLKRFHKDKKG